MHVTLVHVRVTPDRVDDFIEASLANQAASAREPGALRFDLLRDPADPARFVIYEVYRTRRRGRAQGDAALPRVACRRRRLDGRAAPG